MSIQIVPAKSTGGSTGGLVLVGSASPSAAATATISSLNGDNDKVWKIVMHGIWTSADATFISMRPNGDSTAGNYNGVWYFYYSGATIAGTWNTSRMDLCRHGYDVVNPNSLNMEVVFAVSQNASRTFFANTGWQASSVPDGGYQFSGGGYKITTGNITSLDFDFGGGTFTGTINVYQNPY